MRHRTKFSYRTIIIFALCFVPASSWADFSKITGFVRNVDEYGLATTIGKEIPNPFERLGRNALTPGGARQLKEHGKLQSLHKRISKGIDDVFDSAIWGTYAETSAAQDRLSNSVREWRDDSLMDYTPDIVKEAYFKAKSIYGDADYFAQKYRGVSVDRVLESSFEKTSSYFQSGGGATVLRRVGTDKIEKYNFLDEGSSEMFLTGFYNDTLENLLELGERDSYVDVDERLHESEPLNQRNDQIPTNPGRIQEVQGGHLGYSEHETYEATEQERLALALGALREQARNYNAVAAEARGRRQQASDDANETRQAISNSLAASQQSGFYTGDATSGGGVGSAGDMDCSTYKQKAKESIQAHKKFQAEVGAQIRSGQPFGAEREKALALSKKAESWSVRILNADCTQIPKILAESSREVAQW